MTALELAAEPQDEYANVENLFNDPEWCRFQGDYQKVGRFLPNRLHYNATKRAAAIVIEQALGGDFALSQAAFRYVIDALEKADKVVEAYVVLKKRNANQVIKFASVREVERALTGIDPFDGHRGPYWWLGNGLQSASRQSVPAANESF